MISAWVHMLGQAYPEYSDLQYSMEKGPRIKPVLTKVKNQWRLTLEEEWHHDSGGSYTINSGSVMLDDIVEWTEKELTKWKDCNRTAWDMWQFKYKRDAEKFITLFHLIWQQ
jgi:hypothetical protein